MIKQHKSLPTLSKSISTSFHSGDIQALHDSIVRAQRKACNTGGEYIEELFNTIDRVRYTNNGVIFEHSDVSMTPPKEDEVVLLTLSISLCGTDLSLIQKAKEGTLPKESIGKIVGHEAAGIIIGLGKKYKDWKIGNIVCLDSHYACDQHQSFDACVQTLKGCDGIVGGIRGSQKLSGERNPPINGYWSNKIITPISALTVEISLSLFSKLVAASTLESLGNIYMIVKTLEDMGLLKDAQKQPFIVNGLGATGYPMAAVASFYGFDVTAVNPTERKLAFALKNKACDQIHTSLKNIDQQSLHQKNVIITVMSGSQDALIDAVHFLDLLENVKRKVCVVFGLFDDPSIVMPFLPKDYPSISQRDFVFSRKRFTTDTGVEIVGVCGRDMTSWKNLVSDLSQDKGVLIDQLNTAISLLERKNGFQTIANMLNDDSSAIRSLLSEQEKMKLAINFLHPSK